MDWCLRVRGCLGFEVVTAGDGEEAPVGEREGAKI